MQLIPINISMMIRTSLLCKLDYSLIVVSLNFQDSGIPMINNMIMDVQVILVNQLNEFHILMAVVVAGMFG